MKKGTDDYYRATGTVNGVRYNLKSKNQEKLKAKVHAKERELEDGNGIVEPTVTVRDWGERWRETYKTGLRQASAERLKGQLENHVYPHIGQLRVKDVRPINCQGCLNAMSGKGRDTVKKVRSVLHAMFTAAVANRLVKYNPAESLELPDCAEEQTHRSITERERTIQTHYAGAWVLTMLCTGLRSEETAPLTGADIIDGRIRINKALDARTSEIKPPKSNAGYRSIPIPQILADALPEAGPFEPLFQQQSYNKTAYHGKMLTAQVMQTWWKHFREAMAASEQELIEKKELKPLTEALPPIVPYDLRHTFCTDLERAGVPINIASKLMGHANISVTAKIYTHTQQDTIDQAAAALGALYSTPTQSPTLTRQKEAENVSDSVNEQIEEEKINVS